MDKLSLQSDKRYKLFLVEEDDDDRERVISALVDNVEINQDVDSFDVYEFLSDEVVHRYDVPTTATVTLRIVPRGGTLFTIENFLEEDDDV